ncbi:hypothetical protein GCM10017752_64750 [Streptomyces roseoviridis]
MCRGDRSDRIQYPIRRARLSWRDLGVSTGDPALNVRIQYPISNGAATLSSARRCHILSSRSVRYPDISLLLSPGHQANVRSL